MVISIFITLEQANMFYRAWTNGIIIGQTEHVTNQSCMGCGALILTAVNEPVNKTTVQAAKTSLLLLALLL